MQREREYAAFISDLQRFLESKGCPFRQIPQINGQNVDLHQLYTRVTLLGGYARVSQDRKWGQVAADLGIPEFCVNGNFAVRSLYARYLELYERINFAGEDPTDVFGDGFRFSAPFSSSVNFRDGRMMQPSTGPDFFRLYASLASGLPNEVDFAMNVLALSSSVTNSMFKLSMVPAIVTYMLAHTGILPDDDSLLEESFLEWYHDMERDFPKFWLVSSQDTAVVRLLIPGFDESLSRHQCAYDDMFCHKSGSASLSETPEATRITQAITTFCNFSAEEANSLFISQHPTFQRFLALCLISKLSSIRSTAWDTLCGLAGWVTLDPIYSKQTQVLVSIMIEALMSEDRQDRLKAVEALGLLSTVSGNIPVLEEVLTVDVLKPTVYMLVLPDLHMMINVLDFLYHVSASSDVIASNITLVHGSINILAHLLTLDVESLGEDSTCGLSVVENRQPVIAQVVPAFSTSCFPSRTTPFKPSQVVPSPQKMPYTPGMSSLLVSTVQQNHAGINSGPMVQSTKPCVTPVPHQQRFNGSSSFSSRPTPVAVPPQDIDAMALVWLQAAYEHSPGSQVLTIRDIYVDLLNAPMRTRLDQKGMDAIFTKLVRTLLPGKPFTLTDAASCQNMVVPHVRKKSSISLPVDWLSGRSGTGPSSGLPPLVSNPSDASSTVPAAHKGPPAPSPVPMGTSVPPVQGTCASSQIAFMSQLSMDQKLSLRAQLTQELNSCTLQANLLMQQGQRIKLQTQAVVPGGKPLNPAAVDQLRVIESQFQVLSHTYRNIEFVLYQIELSMSSSDTANAQTTAVSCLKEVTSMPSDQLNATHANLVPELAVSPGAHKQAQGQQFEARSNDIGTCSTTGHGFNGLADGGEPNDAMNGQQSEDSMASSASSPCSHDHNDHLSPTQSPFSSPRIRSQSSSPVPGAMLTATVEHHPSQNCLDCNDRVHAEASPSQTLRNGSKHCAHLDTSRPNLRCFWNHCQWSSTNFHRLYDHISESHVTEDSRICLFKGCSVEAEGREALLDHLKTAHFGHSRLISAEDIGENATEVLQLSSARGTAEYAQFLEEEKECTFTKPIRLMAGLVLRNLARNCPLARGIIQRYVDILSTVAFSSSEAAVAAAECLGELYSNHFAVSDQPAAL